MGIAFGQRPGSPATFFGVLGETQLEFSLHASVRLRELSRRAGCSRHFVAASTLLKCRILRCGRRGIPRCVPRASCLLHLFRCCWSLCADARSEGSHAVPSHPVLEGGVANPRSMLTFLAHDMPLDCFCGCGSDFWPVDFCILVFKFPVHQPNSEMHDCESRD